MDVVAPDFFAEASIFLKAQSKFVNAKKSVEPTQLGQKVARLVIAGLLLPANREKGGESRNMQGSRLDLATVF
jgi:hypothetical protein